MGRIETLIGSCGNRGGDCPCRRGECQAVKAIDDRISDVHFKLRQLELELASLDRYRKRLLTPMATLKEGFTFPKGLTPVMVFEGDGEATFGYEDSDGEWIEANEWPFNEQFVWWDDCERNGIRVE